MEFLRLYLKASWSLLQWPLYIALILVTIDTIIHLAEAYTTAFIAITFSLMLVVLVVGPAVVAWQELQDKKNRKGDDN